jgi:hypothetical protein
MRRIVLVAAATALAGCSHVGFRGQQTPYGGSMTEINRPGVKTAVGKSGSRTADAKQVCRGNIENGWIAIDYLSDAQGCTAALKGGQPHPAALVVRYSGLNVGAELEVCSNEHIPTGWIQDGFVDDADGRCPDDKPSGDAARRTVRRIRRIG